MSTVCEPPAQLDLRALADLYESTLKVRNACENRLRAVSQGFDDEPGSPQVANSPLLDRLNEALAQSQQDMEAALATHPVFEWLMGVPGINRTLGCRVLGMIPMDDEDNFVTFSKLRVFAGLCPGRNKLVKGEKACFNKRLKTALYVAFGNMLKAAAICEGKPNAPPRMYAEIYRKWRTIYLDRHGEGKEAKEKGWPDLRQHFAAKNKLLDVFVCHVWRKWREAMGWSVRSLYVHDKLGHHVNFEADEFSSPAMAKKKIKQHG